MINALWLFDMDGTVIDVNSFPLWVMQVLHGHPALRAAARMSVSARCAAAIVQRKLLHGTHHHFRRQLQALWAQIEAAAPQEMPCKPLIDQLAKHVRPSMQRLLQEVTAGNADAILTTAAVAEYTVPFAHTLGFQHVIATPPAGTPDDDSNVGEVKRERTLKYIAARGWAARPRILFTDHCDDLPLMREAAALVWYGSYYEYLRLNQVLSGIPVLLASSVDPDGTYEWVLDCDRTECDACM